MTKKEFKAQQAVGAIPKDALLMYCEDCNRMTVHLSTGYCIDNKRIMDCSECRAAIKKILYQWGKSDDNDS